VGAQVPVTVPRAKRLHVQPNERVVGENVEPAAWRERLDPLAGFHYGERAEQPARIDQGIRRVVGGFGHRPRVRRNGAQGTVQPIRSREITKLSIHRLSFAGAWPDPASQYPSRLIALIP
jgi:hypothetical protein